MNMKNLYGIIHGINHTHTHIRACQTQDHIAARVLSRSLALQHILDDEKVSSQSHCCDEVDERGEVDLIGDCVEI